MEGVTTHEERLPRRVPGVGVRPGLIDNNLNRANEFKESSLGQEHGTLQVVTLVDCYPPSHNFLGRDGVGGAPEALNL